MVDVNRTGAVWIEANGDRFTFQHGIYLVIDAVQRYGTVLADHPGVFSKEIPLQHYRFRIPDTTGLALPGIYWRALESGMNRVVIILLDPDGEQLVRLIQGVDSFPVDMRQELLSAGVPVVMGKGRSIGNCFMVGVLLD